MTETYFDLIGCDVTRDILKYIKSKSERIFKTHAEKSKNGIRFCVEEIKLYSENGIEKKTSRFYYSLKTKNSFDPNKIIIKGDYKNQNIIMTLDQFLENYNLNDNEVKMAYKHPCDSRSNSYIKLDKLLILLDDDF